MLDALAQWWPWSPLVWLFVSGFLSSTLLPGGSELSLWVLLGNDDYSVLSLLLVATSGNTLGGMINYLIGYIFPYSHQKAKASRAWDWVHRYGVWSLLLSWLPLVGDPLCLIAGWLRLPVFYSVIAIALGKAMRYGVIIASY